MMRFALIPLWLMGLLLLAACAGGAPGTPGTANAYINGSAGFYAGASASH